MTKIIIFACIFTCLMIGCSQQDSNKNTLSTNPSVSLTGSNDDGKINIKIDLQKEKIIQAEVDKGHQPWRLEPIDVASTALFETINKKVEHSSCSLESMTGNKATVKCTGPKLYTVHLKRLIRPNGIWTATEVEIKSK